LPFDKPSGLVRMPGGPMTSDVLFFRAAFLQHTPQRYALMITPGEVRRLDQRYDERRGAITNVMLARLLAGEITLAAPAAVNCLAHLLLLDVDAGGIAAVRALITTAAQRNLWAFGQYR